jgi:hypothetical protein
MSSDKFQCATLSEKRTTATDKENLRGLLRLLAKEVARRLPRKTDCTAGENKTATSNSKRG